MQDGALGAFTPDIIWDRLALGLQQFGSYSDWFLAIPVLWVAVAISLWLYSSWQQRRSDRAYLAFASRNLPVLRRIARQRAREVAFSRRTDRF
ncbi:MAG: hypothetical protein ACR2QJ_12030 [Geminicoccaceae bacterium]